MVVDELTAALRKAFEHDEVVGTPKGNGHIIGLDPRTHKFLVTFERGDYSEEEWRANFSAGNGPSRVFWFSREEITKLVEKPPEREIKTHSLIKKGKKK